MGFYTANIGKLHFKNHSNRDHREPHPAYGFDQLILSDEPGCYDDAYIKWVSEQDPSQVENCRCSTPPAWKGKPVHKQPRNTHEPYLFEGPEHLTHTAFVASEIVDFLHAHDSRQPFFAIAGFYAPHTPLNPPSRFVDLYDPASLPLPGMNAGENKLGLSDLDWQRVKAYYYALVTHVDDQIGRILAALEQSGLQENTLVVFTSDHGEHLGDHGLVQKGPPGYDSCVHVPLIFSWPDRIPSGQRRANLVEAVDLAPTLLDYAGVQVPPFFQGQSLRECLQGQPFSPRQSVFIEHRQPFRISWKTVRTHDHKYARSNTGEERLYDLQRDPGELCDYSSDPAYTGLLNNMRVLLLQRWFEVEKQYPLQTGDY